VNSEPVSSTKYRLPNQQLTPIRAGEWQVAGVATSENEIETGLKAG